MINMTTLTPAEKAYMDSGGNSNPYPDEKVETPAETPVETPVEEPKPEAKAEEPAAPEPEKEEGEEDVVEVADGTNPDGTPRRKVINFGAYDKQRKRANTLQQELEKTRQEMAYFQGLLDQVKPRAAQAEPQQPQQTPDYKKEPEKWLEWIHGKAQQVEQSAQQQAQHAQRAQQEQQIANAVAMAEQTFVNGDGEAEGHPDFYDALKWLNQERRTELLDLGYDMNEAAAIMQANAMDISIRALRQNKNPAEQIYKLAVKRGFKAPKPQPKETPAEQIARQAKNQEKAGKTISALPGGESKGLTVEALANMDPKEFQKAWDKGDAKAIIGWNQ